MPKTTVPEAVIAAGGFDPRSNPALAAVLTEGGHVVETVDDTLDDLDFEFEIGGLPARGITAGVARIMEQIRHPYFVQDNADKFGDIEEVLVPIFVLLHPDERELVRWARHGQLREECDIWAFTLDQDWITGATDDFGKYMESYSSKAEDADSEKKTQAVTGLQHTPM